MIDQLALAKIEIQRGLEVAEQEAAHRQFQHSLIQGIHELSLDGILAVNTVGMIVSHNQRFLDVWNVPQEYRDTLTNRLTPGRDADMLAHALAQVAEQGPFMARVQELYGNPEMDDSCEIGMLDGRTLERYSTSLWDETRRHLGRVWFFRDITGRKQSEQALLRSEEKFRQLAEHIHQVFWMMEAGTNKVLYLSPGFEHVWERSCVSLYENPMLWLEAVHPDDRGKAHAWFERQTQGERLDVEYRIRTPGGREKWIRDQAFPIRDEDGRLMRLVGIAEEVTLQKRYEAELIRSREDADAANEAKSRFLANMSHEIRTPMNGVIGMIQLLTETELTHEQRQFADTALSSGQVLLTLINDILDLSKIEAGKIVLEERAFDVRHTIMGVGELLRGSAAAKGIPLTSQVSKDIPEVLVGDAHRLLQVLINLCANAIKFTERGEVAIAVELVDGSESQATVRFTVTDSGIGIRADQVGAIFKPFTQADASTTRKHGGTGLGLTIAKQLVDKMGGSMGVESREGVGSTFWFTAVVRVGNPEAAKGVQLAMVPVEEVGVPDAAAKSLVKILVAEDNPTNQIVVRAQLKKLGYSADVVGNGAQALAALKRTGYDIILMDCEMPVMDGYEATRLIRAMNPGSLAIIALTAHAMSGARDQCTRAGMNDFLSKPLDLHKLGEAIEKWSPREVGVVPVFEAEALLGRLMDDRELAMVIVAGFVENFPVQFAEIERQVVEGHLKAVRVQAHALRGSSATIAAVRLSAVAGELEEAAAAGNSSGLGRLLAALAGEFEVLKDGLNVAGWGADAVAATPPHTVTV